MRNAAKTLFTLTSVAALSACGSDRDSGDDRANAVAVNSSVMEIDTLPADESSTTSSDELANGAADPLENTVENSGGY